MTFLISRLLVKGQGQQNINDEIILYLVSLPQILDKQSSILFSKLESRYWLFKARFKWRSGEEFLTAIKF